MRLILPPRVPSRSGFLRGGCIGPVHGFKKGWGSSAMTMMMESVKGSALRSSQNCFENEVFYINSHWMWGLIEHVECAVFYYCKTSLIACNHCLVYRMRRAYIICPYACILIVNLGSNELYVLRVMFFLNLNLEVKSFVHLFVTLFLNTHISFKTRSWTANQKESKSKIFSLSVSLFVTSDLCQPYFWRT